MKNAQFCSSSRKAKILTTPYDLPDLRGRHEYIEYFEDKAKASLRVKFEPDTEIGQKGRFAKVSNQNRVKGVEYDQPNNIITLIGWLFR